MLLVISMKTPLFKISGVINYNRGLISYRKRSGDILVPAGLFFVSESESYRYLLHLDKRLARNN